jgi:hypothetical protein
MDLPDGLMFVPAASKPEKLKELFKLQSPGTGILCTEGFRAPDR